ncbi:MAG: hypothetical protein AB4911_15860 [Oscillochloridaceae bacterium umkhey_bin13]
MTDPNWTHTEATRALNRLLPRLRSELAEARTADPTGWTHFEARLQHEWPRLFALLLHLYGKRYDCFYHLEQILLATGRAWAERPADLRALDVRRAAQPQWFQHQRMLLMTYRMSSQHHWPTGHRILRGTTPVSFPTTGRRAIASSGWHQLPLMPRHSPGRLRRDAACCVPTPVSLTRVLA